MSLQETVWSAEVPDEGLCHGKHTGRKGWRNTQIGLYITEIVTVQLKQVLVCRVQILQQL